MKGLYTLGIDIGTTSICVIARDIDGGNTVCTRSAANSAKIESAFEWERIQNPDKILEIVNSLVEAVMSEVGGAPAAVGVTGQMHGIVYLDINGYPCSPLYTWQDGRGAQKNAEGISYAEYMSCESGYTLSSGYGAVTEYYNIKNGLVPKDAAVFCTIHDFVAMKLAGKKSPLVHASNAASFGLYDLKENRFDKSAIEALGMDYSRFPMSTEKTAVVGEYKGAPVTVALGDNQASFLGSVGDREDTLLVNVGTGSQVSVIGKLSDKLFGVECRPFIDGKYLIVGSSLCGGRSYAILEKTFRDIANLCGANISSAYPFMDKLMSEYSPAGSLSVSTLFDGTRQDPDIRGKIEGISVDNLTPGELMYGFMRGIAGELNALYSQMGSCVCREDVCRMVGAGNGLRLNRVLCDVISDIFGLSLDLSDVREEAAVGAAIMACRVAE